MMRWMWIGILVLVPSIGSAQTKCGGWQPSRITLLIVAPNGGQTPCQVDFEDFVAFAQAFNSRMGEQSYNANADTNDDGVVNFPDFIAFAGVFGLTFVDTEACLRHQRRHLRTSGLVLQAGKPFENVWIDALKSDSTHVASRVKTDAAGSFTFLGLDPGIYQLAPKRFGYAFSPDTLNIEMGDSSITVPTIQGILQFGLVDVKVVRQDLPVSGVRVSFLRSVAGQAASGPWDGVTDPSGATAIRIPVLAGQEDITGTYVVHVRDRETGGMWDSWMSVPLQTADTRRLVLDIEKEAYYIPEREYFFYDRENKISVTLSEERIRMWFRDDVDENEKMTLLTQLGLEAQDDHFFAMTHDRGRFAVLETIHMLRKSGLVKSVTPELDAGCYWKHRTNHLIIAFKDGVTETERTQFFKDMGASLIRVSDNAYEVEVLDLLSQDVFEISERYQTHPLVRNIRPDFQAVAGVRWLLEGGH